MKIRRFEAPDTKTALAMIKDDLGEEAIILSTRTLAAPAANRRGLIEIVAAVDFDLETVTRKFQPPAAKEKSHHNPRATFGYDESRTTNDRATDKISKQPATHPARGGENNELNKFHHRLSKLLKANYSSQPPQKPLTADRPDPARVEQWRRQLIDQLQIKPIAIAPSDTPTIIALVGATGVGKTTTAAKLAAWFSLHHNYRVTLLSMDCYRIGATDQLRTYGRIMQIPCEIVLQKQDLHRAISRHQQQDLIIIDTAGKSPYDEEHIEELCDWFHTIDQLKPYLVLSATSKKEDINRIIKSYNPLSITGLMLTKLDETRAYAALCQQVAASDLPVAALCTGQKVPEDFLPASKDFLHTLFNCGWSAATANMPVPNVDTFT